MRKNLKPFALLLALLMSVSMLCGGAYADGQFAPGTTIRMWTFLDPYGGTSGREVALKQMMDSFEAEYGVKVIVEPQTWSTMTAKFFTAAASGDAPDVQWINVDDMGTAIKLGVLEPFENLFMKDWTEEQLADAASPFFEFGVTDGLHYQMGFSRNFIGIMYRSDLLEEAGYSVPFENWEQFREAAKALTVENDPLTGTSRYGFGTGFTIDSSDPQIICNMLLDEYGNMFNDDGTANWANPVGVRGATMLRDMMKVDGSISEANLNHTVDDVYKDFAAGKYAMINGASVRMEKARSECVFDPDTIRLMPFPSDTNTYSPTVLTGWSVGVWSGSQNKEAAGKFVEWMFKPENDVLWVQLGGQAPMMNSTPSLLADVLADPSNAYILDTVTCITEAGWAQPTEYSVSGWRGDFNQAMSRPGSRIERGRIQLQQQKRQITAPSPASSRESNEPVTPAY
ncbi:MAG: sugar ABC transporter substrate-binding protein [Clostridia bacterium]|nr:sugar ABC transporter substrate-binding protein [Clostridia bacterium]